MKNKNESNSRREFIGKLAMGTTAGITAMTASFQSIGSAVSTADFQDADEWFKQAKGKHKLLFDASEPHDGLPFIWPWVYYYTNNQTGAMDDDTTALVVLRHNAIPFAMEDRLWKKYNLGEVFNITDSKTNKPALRNLYYEPQDGDFPFPQIDGIKVMQGRGAMFCVCQMAVNVYSGIVAEKANLDPEEVKKDWVSGIHKDIQIVPSGVWAIGRAQGYGFGYCYAGG